MPRKYVRKTNRGASAEDLQKARERVLEGCSVRAAANDLNVARVTLKRYIDKCNKRKSQQQNEVFGYENCKVKNMIFSSEMEEEL